MAENTPKIDYRDTPAGDAVQRPFPAKVPGEYRVHIAPAAYDRMKTHAVTSDEVELCGVLVGEICRDDHGIYLDISGFIEGEGASSREQQVAEFPVGRNLSHGHFPGGGRYCGRITQTMMVHTKDDDRFRDFHGSEGLGGDAAGVEITCMRRDRCQRFAGGS